MSFLKFDPTPENREKLHQIYKEANSGFNERLPSPETYDKLLQHPLTRVSYMWCRIFPQSALSPFGLAGITQNPPRDCIKQMQEEHTFTHIDYCSVVELPVCFISYAIRPEGWSIKVQDLDTRRYDMEIAERQEEEKDSCDFGERTPGSATWPNRTLEKMLKRWGGKTWKKHCRRVFDPFHASDGNEITHRQWRLLKKAYFLTSSGRPE